MKNKEIDEKAVSTSFTTSDTRLWLTGQALAGICANPVIAEDSKKECRKCKEGDKLIPMVYAALAIAAADAALASLEGRGP